MQFPKNKTEIMDQVAVFAADKEMPYKEKEPLIRLALMHWNYVPDQTPPTIAYEGFDVNVISPVKQLYVVDLINGADDYIFERSDKLNAQLATISKELNRVEGLRDGRGFEGGGHIIIMNELLNEKSDIVAQLSSLNYEVINRVINFSFHETQLSISGRGLTNDLKDLLANEREFEVGIDVRLVSEDYTSTVQVFADDKKVKSVFNYVKNYFDMHADVAGDPDVFIREHHEALPSFKDNGDEINREARRMDMLREEKKMIADVDFSAMHNSR